MTTLTNKIPGVPRYFGSSFGFIRAPLTRVVDNAFAWRQELDFNPILTTFSGGLVTNATHLLPLEPSPVFRDLFVATRGNDWTAYFNANPFGGDPGGAVRYVGRQLQVPTVLVTSVPFRENYDDPDHPLGGITFAYAEVDPYTNVRSIALTEGESSSSRYHFEAFGPEQPWEDSERYTARRKQDRFDPALLEEYCRALGLDVFNLEFYCGPSALIVKTEEG